MRQLADIERQIDTNFRRRLAHVLKSHHPQRLNALPSAMESDPRDLGDFFGLLDRLNHETKAPGVVLRFGLARSILDLGLIGFTILSCRDVGQALDVIYRYHALTSDAYQVHLAEEGDRVVLQAWVRPGSRDQRVVIAEEFVTGFWVVLSELLPSSTNRDLINMRLDYPAPDYADLYSQLMPCKVAFGARPLSLSFPAEWRSLRLQTADETVEAVCRAQCDELLGAISPGVGIVDDVRRLILSVPSNRPPLLRKVAAQMMMSPRTLERRLRQVGHSFRRIDNEVRMGLAAQYVALGSISGKEISSMLGYSEPAAFYRAFKQWHGETPRQYRLARSG
jgi:AraC-like DNA-binding protein